MDTKQTRVLMVAYACDPASWGEHWLGWKWAEEAARHYQITLVTQSLGRESIDRLAPALGITPVYVDVPTHQHPIVGRFARNQNVVHQLLWQRHLWPVVQRLHRAAPFHLTHQTTFHSFRVPFLANQLPIPSVWGPMAGGESFPPGFGRFLGPKHRSEVLRSIINRPWLNIPHVRQALQRSSALWVSNQVTRQFLPPELQAKASVVPPNAIRPEDLACEDLFAPLEGKPLSLLYIGNCVATRSIPLVLEALKQARLAPGWTFNVIGEGPAIPHWKSEIARHRLQENVHLHGHRSRAELDAFYRQSHALVFPGLRDSGGSALIEAMSKGIPVVYLDWAGPAEMADPTSGIAIPVRDPDETLRLMAAAFERLVHDVAWRQEIGRNARARVAQHFAWDAKIEILKQTYTRLLQEC